MLSASRNDRKIAWYESSGGPDPQFTPHTITTTADGAIFVTAADLNQDGYKDVIAASQFDGMITWYPNTLGILSGSLHVTSPNGGESLQGGSEIEIAWQARVGQTGPEVRLELWNSQGRVSDLGYGWAADGNGTMKLYLPLVPGGDDYRLRATSTKDSTIWDQSDMPFSVTGGPLRIESPNGGQTWPAGSYQWIAWRSNVTIAGTGVRFELWRDGAWFCDLGFGWDPQGVGNSRIFVPKSVWAGKKYKLRVISTWNPAWFDESDAFITIQNHNAANPEAWVHYR